MTIAIERASRRDSDSPVARPASEEPGRVEIWDVSVSFRRDGRTTHALQNTRVNIEAGSFVCLLGGSARVMCA